MAIDPVVFQELQNAELSVQIRNRQRSRTMSDLIHSAEDRAMYAENDVARLRAELDKTRHEAACARLALRWALCRASGFDKELRRLNEELGSRDGRSVDELHAAARQAVEQSAKASWSNPANTARLSEDVQQWVEHFKRTQPAAR